MPLTRLWKTGPCPANGPVYVNLNDYWIHRWRDVPRVAIAGMRLRRQWPSTKGAVGLWFASSLTGRRQVSVSVWRTSADLQHFVHSPSHTEIMRRFKDTGILHTSAWSADGNDRRAIWKQAHDRLMSRVEGGSHQ